MGRFSNKTSPLTAPTLVLMPINETTVGGIGSNGGYGVLGLDAFTVASLSATTTLLSVDGPGVLRYADIASAAATGPARAQVWLDDVLVYDQSVNFASALLLNMVGATVGAGSVGFARTWLCDDIPFKSSAKILFSSAPTAGTYYYSVSYRLTQ